MGLKRGQERVWKGVKTGLERGQKLVLNGIKKGISPDSRIWNGVERPFFAVPHLYSLLFACPPLFSPVFDDFRQKQGKRSSENRGTGKETKAFFPVSFPSLFSPFLSRHISSSGFVLLGPRSPGCRSDSWSEIQQRMRSL